MRIVEIELLCVWCFPAHSLLRVLPGLLLSVTSLMFWCLAVTGVVELWWLLSEQPILFLHASISLESAGAAC